MLKKNLDDLGTEKVQEMLNNSISIVDFFRKVETKDIGGNRKTLYRFIENNNLELKQLIENRNKALRDGVFLVNKKTEKDLFIENSSVQRSVVKNRIIKDNLIDYKCSGCGNIGEWQGKEISLHLDHINGISNDNRLENLRFLCPNCHSQTDTFAGKNYKSDLFKDYFKEKKEVLNQNNKEKECLIEERRKSLEQVDLTKFGWNVKVSKIWNVSQTQVRRWIKKYYPDIEFYERKKAQ
jgi:5-methylcytosine-specific restriction endonuclease McrA